MDYRCGFLKNQIHRFPLLNLRANYLLCPNSNSLLLTDNAFPSASGTGQTRTYPAAPATSATTLAFLGKTRHGNRSFAVANDTGSGISEGDAPFTGAAAPGAIYLRLAICCGLPENPISSNYSKYLWQGHTRNLRIRSLVRQRGDINGHNRNK